MVAKRISESPSFDIRYTEFGDERYLIRWLSHPEIAKWYAPSNEKELGQFAKNWIGYSRYKCSLTATYERIPRGIATLFLMPYRKVAHMSMGYMIVDPGFQKRGIGNALLKNLQHLAKNYFRLESMHFEVYENSPIIILLRKYGYHECFRQENYVRDPHGIFLARQVFEGTLP